MDFNTIPNDHTFIIQLFGHCIAMWYAMSESLVNLTEIGTSCRRGETVTQKLINTFPTAAHSSPNIINKACLSSRLLENAGQQMISMKLQKPYTNNFATSGFKFMFTPVQCKHTTFQFCILVAYQKLCEIVLFIFIILDKCNVFIQKFQ